MIAVPQSFVDMPRWWGDEGGRAWLIRLPVLVERQCARWGLEIDGPALHGSNALVVPVRRGEESAALRLAPPSDDVIAESAALAHWNGRGVAQLMEVDPPAGATLLERLDHSRSLLDEPVHDAVATLGAITRLLAVPAPPTTRSTGEIALEATTSFPLDWTGLAGPTSRSLLDEACAAASVLAARPTQALSVNGDLHFEQVLAGHRYPWTVVDPVLLRGDPEYDIGRVLWSRLDELADDDQVYGAFDTFVTAADVPSDRAREWVLVRSMSYLLWGMRHGLTWDPPKCRRLLELFA